MLNVFNLSGFGDLPSIKNIIKLKKKYDAPTIEELPDTYKTNTHKERLYLWAAANFVKQVQVELFMKHIFSLLCISFLIFFSLFIFDPSVLFLSSLSSLFKFHKHVSYGNVKTKLLCQTRLGFDAVWILLHSFGGSGSTFLESNFQKCGPVCFFLLLS